VIKQDSQFPNLSKILVNH